MKKILLAIAIVLTLGLGANAQRDGFIGNEGISDDRTSPNEWLQMPTQEIGSPNNESVPLGTGLLIMTALGGAYMLRKRK